MLKQGKEKIKQELLHKAIEITLNRDRNYLKSRSREYPNDLWYCYYNYKAGHRLGIFKFTDQPNFYVIKSLP